MMTIKPKQRSGQTRQLSGASGDKLTPLSQADFHADESCDSQAPARGRPGLGRAAPRSRPDNKLFTLTLADFNAAADKMPRLTEQSRANLRLVLVENQTPKQVLAEQHKGKPWNGISGIDALYKSAYRMLEVYLTKVKGVPPGYVRITVVLPESRAKEVESESLQSLRDAQ